MSELTVYSQITKGPEQLFAAMKREIGYKCTCVPFAVKMVEALNTLEIKTEQQALTAANVFMSNLQTLIHGGILPDDYDKIDAVKRGQTITLSARVDAFYRAAARKGYQITDTIIAIPKEDVGGVYFKENFVDGAVIYTLEDCRKNTDRKITAERLISGYFDSFVCRLTIYDIRQKRNIMVVCDMSSEEVMMAQSASDNGIYCTQWVPKKDETGIVMKRRDGSVINEKISGAINPNSFWVKWTRDMVEKTIIRKALKRVREILPDLTATIYAFTNEEVIESQPEEEIITIPIETQNVDLSNLTEEQKADVDEMRKLFLANPKLARDTANDIMSAFYEKGEDAQSLINKHYASIANLKRGVRTAKIIAPLFGE